MSADGGQDLTNLKDPSLPPDEAQAVPQLKRLVRDTEQGAIGYTQAKSLRRNRTALHANGKGSREVDALAFRFLA